MTAFGAFPTRGEERGKYAIYKRNLETREEELIVEGGLNPDWRSTPVDAPRALVSLTE